MAKHRFHSLKECPAHITWLTGKGTTKFCSLLYVFNIKGTVESYEANHDPFPRHAKETEGVWK